jgi:hypothetical protein
MFLKRRVRRKDGIDHIYDSVCESLRVHSGRVICPALVSRDRLRDMWPTLAFYHATCPRDGIMRPSKVRNLG